ncbi:MAG: HAMP domain-containing sensor histidine kinase [Lachnospiraceae bacterium]
MRSIRKQFALTTIVLMVATILICWIANVLFLERYYINGKKEGMFEVYNFLAEQCEEEDFMEEEFMIELEKLCDQHNLSILVTNSNRYPLIYTSIDLESLNTRLFKYILAYEASERLVEGENIFLAYDVEDSRTLTSKMEMWGQLDTGDLFLLSTPMESISDSVAISNQFLAVIGFIAVAISGLIIWYYSGKVSKPILKIAALSQSITNLDFEEKYDGKDKNELAVLGNNMNLLSESLERTISELKSANIELQKDIQLKEAVDLQRQEFVSHVSHELKTPIALIQGYAEGIKDGIIEDKESMDYYLDVILDEASRMNKMVKSFMELNELESGIDAIALERFDLTSLVEGYLMNMDILVKEQDVLIETNLPDSIFAWGDEFKVEEVLMNYISNALHHIKGEEKKIIISIEELENQVKVSVFNTGEGIPEESLEHLWEKFYKVDKARSRQYGGSGVGLSIVKAIQERMNQEYGVKNTDGGVSFWFTLDKA